MATFYEFAEKALSLEKAGKKIVRLNIGDTNLPAPAVAVEAAAKSMREGKSGYTPLVSIAKETCMDKSHYDAVGEKGLLAWLEFFMNKK